MVDKRKVIAFIPVRGGSKSIPLKNIKPFCGEPLVCWNIKALEKCDLVDEIIVATDSQKIWDIVEQKAYKKVKLYRRLAENASDSASTESVMIEYIMRENISKDTIFLLAQATSPLTQSIHFKEGLELFFSGVYDSVLSCVRNYRFFWNEDGSSINYDYKNRPRRQEFKGLLMENGAFYISTVDQIKENKNRLSGRIGIYEMPNYTAMEIDEPDDWILMEKLMHEHILSENNSINRNIKLFLCDVDGTLTDGGMYYSSSGEELKKFNTKDGMGFQLLRESHIKTGIITSEDTQIVSNRAKKLHIDYLYQGKRDEGKFQIAKKICDDMGISLSEIAYIGDDKNCVELLSSVGRKACPSDANQKVKEIAGIEIMTARGGEGCVREFIEKILNEL